MEHTYVHTKYPKICMEIRLKKLKIYWNSENLWQVFSELISYKNENVYWEMPEVEVGEIPFNTNNVNLLCFASLIHCASIMKSINIQNISFSLSEYDVLWCVMCVMYVMGECVCVDLFLIC